jgi:hypothetical protein
MAHDVTAVPIAVTSSVRTTWADTSEDGSVPGERAVNRSVRSQYRPERGEAP